MRKRSTVFLIAIALLAALQATTASPPAQASPADDYSGPYFGDANLPPGCIRDMSLTNLLNTCYHMRTDMNGLDSSQVDVLIMVPVSPTAERDMRIMRQSIEMWEAGIDYLAGEMGLDWLADGMDFHITVDAFDPEDKAGGEFTTYPIADPEIVVIATNPVGGIGIGIDPVDAAFENEDEVPCHGASNPFDFEEWENLPGFESHHEDRSGTYLTAEDCDTGGGNVCFAVNGAIDPAPEVVDVFSIFDLVSHEFGHCLTIGHVGDGAEGAWGALPSNDIMAYSQDPPGLHKCVSTLDVEGIALRMSKYIDIDNSGSVDGGDLLLANDMIGDGSNPFQVQHPDDHLYASGTGSPMDCPQPDLGLVPGPRTEWTPTSVDTNDAELTISSPQDGTVSNDGAFNVTGTVEHVAPVVDPLESTGSFDDADDDASTPITEITKLDVVVTETNVEATISLADLWPTTALASPTSYSVIIDGRKFDSFIRYAVDANPMTWDGGAGAYLPAGSSSWDLLKKTVSFHIPRSYLADAAVAPAVTSPYYVGSQANFGLLSTTVVDDSAPEAGETVDVAAPTTGASVVDVGAPAVSVGSQLATVSFGNPEVNKFYPEDSTFGVPPFVLDTGSSHDFTLDVVGTSDIEFTLGWTETVGGSDLDLYVTGGVDSGSTGATSAMPETFVLEDVKGHFDIRVEPYLVTDVLGVKYTLTATVSPAGGGLDTDGDGFFGVDDNCPDVPGTASGCPDSDGDGVADGVDGCPSQAGAGANGCPIAATEQVRLYVDGALATSQDVDTSNGPDNFSLTTADLAEGTHELRVEWEDEGEVIDSETITVTHSTDDDGDGVANASDACPGFDDKADQDGDGIPDACDPDLDGDGDHVADDVDNCPAVANADQANMDGDAKGDVCDSDMDGDGHSNGKERAQGTNPADPNSYPTKARS